MLLKNFNQTFTLSIMPNQDDALTRRVIKLSKREEMFQIQYPYSIVCNTNYIRKDQS